VQATVYDDAVRLTVQNDQVEILRAEVFNLGGKRLFDSGPTMGDALDWVVATESGEQMAHGIFAQFFSNAALQGLTPVIAPYAEVCGSF
jgi:hypothetical protein